MKSISYSEPNIAVMARALRLPFLTASILPFIAGSCIEKGSFMFSFFLLGILSVIATHIGANLLNDYADSKSGADWQDGRFYTFFGGSKLIQEGVLTERFYLTASLFFFGIGFLSALFLTVASRRLEIIFFYLIILFLGFSYSERPLQLSYRKLGEVVIFLLFGPALVMGGHFIQTGLFPTLKGFVIALPFGFLTTAILFANEIPDYQVDRGVNKINWVQLLGPERSYMLYGVIILCAFAAVVLNISMGYLNPVSYLSFIAVIPAIKAGIILKRHYSNKPKMIESSRLVILTQAAASLIVTLGIIL